MMVGFSLDDGTCTINLFGEGHAYHLMREGHHRQADLMVGSLIDSGGETIRASDDEDQATRCGTLLFQPCCKFDTSHLLAVFIKQDNGV